MPPTPLHVASAAGHVEIVQMLLKKGARPHVRDNNGRTALDLARAGGHDEVARLLERATDVRERVMKAIAQRSASIAPATQRVAIDVTAAQRRLWVEGLPTTHATPGYIGRMDLALQLRRHASVEAALHRRERHAETPEVTVNFELGDCGQSDSTS